MGFWPRIPLAHGNGYLNRLIAWIGFVVGDAYGAYATMGSCSGREPAEMWVLPLMILEMHMPPVRGDTHQRAAGTGNQESSF